MSGVKTRALSAAAPALAERAQGRQPSRAKSLLTSATVGLAAAFLTYRLLRSGGTVSNDES